MNIHATIIVCVMHASAIRTPTPDSFRSLRWTMSFVTFDLNGDKQGQRQREEQSWKLNYLWPAFEVSFPRPVLHMFQHSALVF